MSEELKPLLIRKKDAARIFRKFVQKNIRSKIGIVHIAEINGKPVGYSLAFIKDNVRVYKTEKVGYISDLFIKKESRAKGISSKFKDEAIKWFRKKGINHISIAVHKENRLAYSIYRKWGFLDYHIEMRRKIYGHFFPFPSIAT